MEKIKNFINDSIIEQIKFAWSEHVIKQDEFYKDRLHQFNYTRICLIVPTILIIIFIIFDITKMVIREWDYVEVQAYVSSKYYDSSTSRRKGKSYTTYKRRVDFEFWYEGEPYTAASNGFVMFLNRGDLKKIKINPDNPTQMKKFDLHYIIFGYGLTLLFYSPIFLYNFEEYYFLKRCKTKMENIIKYKFKDAEIIIENHIIGNIELDDCVVILIDISSKYGTNIPQNVYCYDTKGQVIWQIDPGDNMFGVKPDVDVYKFEKIDFINNYLYVITGNIAFAIDVKTGKYLGHNFM